MPVTGVADIGTVLAIEAYQAVVLKMTPPSGAVEPGSQTYYALAARPLIEPPRPDAVGRFGKVPPDVIEAAVASKMKWSVPASDHDGAMGGGERLGRVDAAGQQQPVRHQGSRAASPRSRA